MLFPQERMNFIKPLISNRQAVISYANKYDVHPSIIYGFYLYDNKENASKLYPKFRKYLTSSEDAISDISTNIWEAKNSLKQEIEKIIRKITT